MTGCALDIHSIVASRPTNLLPWREALSSLCARLCGSATMCASSSSSDAYTPKRVCNRDLLLIGAGEGVDMDSARYVCNVLIVYVHIYSAWQSTVAICNT